MPRPYPGKTPVFHIIPVEKLSSVIQHGLLCDVLARQSFGEQTSVDAAHDRLKERRRSKPVNVAQGGVMADYVPFYFGPRSPMLFSIKCGNTEYGRTGRGQPGMIHLVCRLESLAKDFADQWCFIDAHPTRAWARFGDSTAAIDDRIDFEVMKAQWWREPDETKASRQAELLVHGSVPWRYVELIVVINDRIADEVRTIIDDAGTAHKPTVHARPPGRYEGSPFPCGYYY